MKIELSPQIGDVFPGIIWEAHEIGSQMKSMGSMPCSICRAVFDSGVDQITRTHFHGSDFGSCARKVFNTMKYGKNAGISGAGFLMDGHLHEGSMLENIKAGLPDGWKLKAFGNDKECIKEIGNDMQMVCHPDGIITNGTDYALLECKALKEYSFRKIREKEEISNEYYAQCQAYMLAYNVPLTYLIVKHRETSKILMPIRIERNMDYIIGRLNKLKDIYDRLNLNSEQPDREHKSSKEDECKFCSYGNENGNGDCWRE